MMMKVLIISLFFSICSPMLFAQTVDDIGKVVLGVRFLEGISEETKENRLQLEDKLVKFATQAGYSSFGNNVFFISPNIVVNNVDVAEGGMKSVYVVRGELYLTIQDDINGTVYSSMSFPFKGSATKEAMAIKNAILNINYGKVAIVFDEAKRKILSYYEQRKEIIFARANTCAANGDYDEAIACLMMIPEELTELHSQALEKALSIYSMRDEAIRKQIIADRNSSNEVVLARANSLLAMHKPKEALTVLWNYQRGNVEQDSRYLSIVAKAEGLVSTEEQEVLRKEERAYQDDKRKEERTWSEYEKDAEHKRDMDRKEVGLRKQKIEATERMTHHKLDVAEKLVCYELNVDEQQIRALKDVACEYLRNNPLKIGYISVNY